MGTDNLHHTRKVKRNEPTRELNPAFLIVCEGKKTEKNYFEAFTDCFRLTNLHIKPSPKSDIGHIINFAKAQQKQQKRQGQGYETIFCVFDADTCNEHEARQMIEPPLRAIISKPCFEYWILLHFTYSNKCFGSSRNGGKSPCDELIDTALKEHLPDYDKNYNKFSKLITEETLAKAIKGAKQSKIAHKESPNYCYTDVYKIIEQFLPSTS